jgi:GT2 family glycosyltransferase
MTRTSSPAIAIVMVHYGNYAREHFQHCYETLARQSLPVAPCSLFIVSNGASKGSDDFVRSVAPEARYFSLARNQGWSVANNVGIRAALEDRYDYIVLLNMDVSLERDWLLHLVEEAKANPGAHIFQSKMLLFGTTKINSMGNKIHFLGYGYCEGYGEEDRPGTPSKEIDFASGASMLVKREVFERIGLLEESYFLYYDDLEFCWRARIAGYGVVLAPRSVCFHKHAIEEKLQYIYDLEKNRLLTLFTLESLKSLLLILPLLVMAQIVSGIYLSFKGKFLPLCRLYGSLAHFKTWAFVREKRRSVRKVRSRQDADILKHFSPHIFFADMKHPVITTIVNPILAWYWRIIRGSI